MPNASAADVAKNFGAYREQAQREPVIVTQYGKPSVVILSAEEYARLQELDRRILRLEEMSDDELDEMLTAEIPPEHRYSINDIPD
ncbi:type II toxin-antitoxin system Phd/YefM family antitoxin [Indioceanicola profundi]|uniref:type II toxin-antitoxin system Phd/YefM family antitoxin n=1 Tax=Indioceanicola profundi TaxID=2220096 RepID=UPI0013C4589B|nr:type II toxin-antitoxin system Phd/YefM family antitoxin [Indioceanicola profundi]